MAGRGATRSCKQCLPISFSLLCLSPNPAGYVRSLSWKSRASSRSSPINPAFLLPPCDDICLLPLCEHPKLGTEHPELHAPKETRSQNPHLRELDHACGCSGVLQTPQAAVSLAAVYSLDISSGFTWFSVLGRQRFMHAVQALRALELSFGSVCAAAELYPVALCFMEVFQLCFPETAVAAEETPKGETGEGFPPPMPPSNAWGLCSGTVALGFASRCCPSLGACRKGT